MKNNKEKRKILFLMNLRIFLHTLITVFFYYYYILNEYTNQANSSRGAIKRNPTRIIKGIINSAFLWKK